MSYYLAERAIKSQQWRQWRKIFITNSESTFCQTNILSWSLVNMRLWCGYEWYEGIIIQIIWYFAGFPTALLSNLQNWGEVYGFGFEEGSRFGEFLGYSRAIGDFISKCIFCMAGCLWNFTIELLLIFWFCDNFINSMVFSNWYIYSTQFIDDNLLIC